jgi:hypothetical protein
MLSTAETGLQISRKQMYRVICHLEAIPNFHQLMYVFTNKGTGELEIQVWREV